MTYFLISWVLGGLGVAIILKLFKTKRPGLCYHPKELQAFPKDIEGHKFKICGSCGQVWESKNGHWEIV